MSQKHIQILLSCLDLSYDAAIQFDSRPGLKFLIQKVAGMERAANLYRQAGAAWILKVVTLFDISLHELKKTGATLDCVKKIIENEDSKLKQELDKASKSPSNKQEDSMMESHKESENSYNDMTTFLLRLRHSFDKLCDTYIDVVLDKDGTHSAVDRISDQPIFFLIAQTDDFPDFKWKDVSEHLVSNFEDVKVSEDQDTSTGESDDTKDEEIIGESEKRSEINYEQVGEKLSVEKEAKKPFMFADLAHQYNDSASEGEADQTLKEDSVYNVAGGTEVESLMEEYKRRKQLCSLPLTSQVEKRKNPFCTQRKTSIEPPLVPNDPLPPEIEQQRKNSIYKVSIFKFSHKLCFNLLTF